ncbi:MAG: ABC transporter substrate-binding protein [Clostridia bacterium]|nr:ABC transporter substrate-binding protein [Clostridia bacterium]
MKKILSLTLAIVLVAISLLAFSSCNDKKTDEAINVATLNGTTGFGMAPLMKENAQGTTSNKYDFSVQTDPTVVMAGLINGSIDIATLPTNAAANAYNKTNGGVQIIAINTLGVLYLVTNNIEVTSMADLEGKTIYCPAQNPTFIAKYIVEKNNLAGKVTIDSTTYAQPDALRAAVISGIVDYAVLPEPMVTIATSANKNLKTTLDFTSEWNKISDGKQLVQGCVVVRTEFANQYPGSVKEFLKEYKNSIEAVNNNPASAAALIKEFGIFANDKVASKAIPNCNIAYLDGNDMKNAMSNFLEAMYSIAPASIGNAIPNNDFYYGA